MGKDAIVEWDQKPVPMIPPRLNNTGNGEVVNAVEIENIIRRETNEKERKEDPKHVQ